jgi:hypothetical protein
MSSNHTSRVDLVAADQAMIDGINKNLSKLPPSFPVGSQTVTPAQVVQVFQDRLTTAKAVVAADAARTAAVKADRDKRTQTKPFAEAFRRLVIAMFLQSPDTLGDFGLAAPKVPQKSAETKATAAAKGTATRKSKDAKAVKPATEPAAPAAPPAAPAKPAS